MTGPKLLNSGKDAMAAVAKILPTAQTIRVNSSMGPVDLKPGTLWSGNRMLFYAAPMYVWYSIDDRVYEWGTGDFIRDEWFNALSRGAHGAEGMVTLAHIEFALLSGIFVPWYLLLGLSCARTGFFYVGHKAAVDAAMKQAPQVIDLLRDLRHRSPTLFNTLMKTAAKDLLMNLPSGVS